MSLSGDARRWRVLDRMKYTRERKQLEARLAGLYEAIVEARKNPHAFKQQLALTSLRKTFLAVHSDWATAKAREESARFDTEQSC